VKRKKLFPLFVYCAVCRTCRYRKFKNLFDDKSMLDCADCNGLTVQTIIPFILWRVSWCKLYSKKRKYKYPYYCTQPNIAKTNGCHYGPTSCDHKCLMPYKGCNYQDDENNR
jgi:hypothetical protein